MTAPDTTPDTAAVTRPDAAAFAVVAALSGHGLTTELVAGAAAAHATMAGATAAMRAVPLALVGAIEPAHALQRLWGAQTAELPVEPPAQSPTPTTLPAQSTPPSPPQAPSPPSPPPPPAS